MLAGMLHAFRYRKMYAIDALMFLCAEHHTEKTARCVHDV